MPKVAHFFDIDPLVKIEQKAWIVDKFKPRVPLLKIDISDFNLFKSGIYKSQDNRIDFNGKEFWLDTDTMNKIKVKLKLSGSSPDSLAISMIEFLDKDVISSLPYTINTNIIETLKNSDSPIYLILSKQTAPAFGDILKDILEKFREMGTTIEKYYYVTQTFWTKNRDEVKYAKLKVLAEHLSGYKIENNQFQDEKREQYDTVHYWDDSYDTDNYPDYMEDFIRVCHMNTQGGMKDVVGEDFNEIQRKFVSHKITENKENQISRKDRIIRIRKFIKTFECYQTNNQSF